MENRDEFYMKRAIELAKQGSGYVHPNPMVGCVIVKDNKIISEGFHEYFGGAHAEVNAIEKLEANGFDEWNRVVLYVTLEPCSHFGKTPPCADLIVKKGIKKVVIANVDINPIVAGKGIQKLKDNGTEVIIGILEKEAKELNKRFFTYHSEKRPYIVLKWAETKDGFISKTNFLKREDNVISSAEALKIAHQWRSEEQSILVGYNTVLIDNPYLNVRLVKGKNPIKILLDKNLNLNVQNLNVSGGMEKIIIFNEIKSDVNENIIYKKIDWKNKNEEIMKNLYEMEIVSILIEGGTKTLQGFIDNNLFDEIRIIKSKNKMFYEGLKHPEIMQDIKVIEKIDLPEDEILIYGK